MNRLRYFLKTPLRPVSLKPPVFKDKPTRVTKGGLNFHKSNRAREGDHKCCPVYCTALQVY